MPNNDEEKKPDTSWAIVELMGHVQLAGRLTKPTEHGLWQIDIPDDTTENDYRTEFFGDRAVYRIRLVSAEIAAAYASIQAPAIEYDAPIVTREEFMKSMNRYQRQLHELEVENRDLRNRLPATEKTPKDLPDDIGDHPGDESPFQDDRCARRRTHFPPGCVVLEPPVFTFRHAVFRPALPD